MKKFTNKILIISGCVILLINFISANIIARGDKKSYDKYLEMIKNQQNDSIKKQIYIQNSDVDSLKN